MKTPTVAALAALSLAGCKNDPPPVAEARPVRSIVVSHQPSGETLSLTGLIQAKEQVNLAFRIGGRVRARTVDVGDIVRPGQVVASLETQDFQNDLRLKQAALVSAQAVLANATTIKGRQSDLIAKGFTTQAEFDSADQQLKSAQAQVESAEASVQNARDNLSYTDLTADVSGAITAKGAEPGEIVAAGKTVLVVAGQTGRDAVFNIPGRFLGSSPQHLQVAVGLAGNPSIVATGHVREVAPQADPSTGTYPVKVGLDQPPEGMRLGETVIGTVKTGGQPVIQLPATSLTSSQNKPAIWLVDPQTLRVSLRTVTTGRYGTSTVEVTDGLKDGDIVVTAGVQALRPDQQVRLLGQAERRQQ